MDYIDQPLENVCAFQWWSANKHVMQGIESGAISRHMVVKYEDLLNLESLQKELFKAFDFAHLPPDAVLDNFKAPSSVMSVNPPGRKKWIKRSTVILPALKDRTLASVALSLGYDINFAERFV